MLTKKSSLPLALLAGLAIFSVIYYWGSGGDRPDRAPGVGVESHASGGSLKAPGEPVIHQAEVDSREQLEREISDSADGRTTWEARLVMREGAHPLAGATVRIELLSPDATREEDAQFVLVTGQDGETDPILIPFERYPAAEVRVDPGPRWAGTSRVVQFVGGKANQDVLELDPRVALSVQVVDLHRKVGFAGAAVTVHGAGRVVAEATSNTQGLAAIPWEIHGGPFVVRASAPGYSSLNRAELPHPPGTDQEVRLLLALEASLRVRVVDEAGQMLPDCRVTVGLAQAVLGSASNAPDAPVITASWEPSGQESGVFVFASVPCEATLAVEAVTKDGLAGREYVSIDPASRIGAVTVTIGDVDGTRIRTLDDRGEPLAEVNLIMGKEKLGVTDAGGHLVLKLQDSSSGKELLAFKPEYALAWQSWTPEQRELTYFLAPEQRVSGTVVNSSGRPQALVRVIPMLGTSEEPRDARMARGEMLLVESDAPARGTSSSGTFTLRGLPGGSLDLFVRPPKGSPFEVRGVIVGTPDLVITLPGEDSLGRDLGIALAIRVVDQQSGAPLSKVSVSAFLAPDAETGSSIEGGRGTTKGDGRVRVTSALEGRYAVSANAEGYLPYFGPIVEYPVGEHTLEIQLTRSAELAVQVTGRDGIAWQNYRISAVDSTGAQVYFRHVEKGASQSWAELITDAEGRARANVMPPGELTLEVRATSDRAGEPLIRETVELVPGERLEVALRRR